MTQRTYFYSLYQRIWHWTQAVSVVPLLLTGLVIHNPDTFFMFSFAGAVAAHNVLAVILLLNGALGLFYYLATGELSQLLPQLRGLPGEVLAEARHYLKGIFRGEAHPHRKLPQRRLNPLQRVVYFAILNVLLPLQVISGVLIWGAQHWPGAVAWLGGLPALAFVHSLGAWVFGAFLAMHVYLTTTGRTPLANITTMLTGWEEAEEAAAPEGSSP